jgi:hypothetical protein
MGFIVSYVVRRRWLSLIGLAVGLLAVPFYVAGKAEVGAFMIFAGGALLATQVLISFIRNLRARQKGLPPTF